MMRVSVHFRIAPMATSPADTREDSHIESSSAKDAVAITICGILSGKGEILRRFVAEVEAGTVRYSSRNYSEESSTQGNPT